MKYKGFLRRNGENAEWMISDEKGMVLGSGISTPQPGSTDERDTLADAYHQMGEIFKKYGDGDMDIEFDLRSDEERLRGVK